MEGMPKACTLKSVAGAGMILKEFAQNVVTEGLGAFNGIKISLEKGGKVRRDTDNWRKSVVKTTGEKRFQQQVPPGAREGRWDSQGWSSVTTKTIDTGRAALGTLPRQP